MYTTPSLKTRMFSAGDGNCRSIAMGRGACLAVSSRPLGQRQRRPDGRTCSCCSGERQLDGGWRIVVDCERQHSRTTSCRRETATICPAPVTLTFDLLNLKVVSESHVTWATSVLILTSLGLSVLELRPMYATDRRQADRRQTKSSLNAPLIRGGA